MRSGLAGRRPGKDRSPRRDALRRLGLNTVPTIDSFSVRAVCAAGGKRSFLDYARTSENPKVQDLIKKYDSLSKSDQSALSITDLCAACEMSFDVLLGQVTAQAFAHIIAINAAQRSKLLPTAVDAENQGEQPAEGTGMRETSRNSAG